MSYAHKLNAAKVREETLKAIAKNKLRAHVHEVLARELKAFNGKKITAKLATRMKECFPDYSFSVDDMKESHRYLRGNYWAQYQNIDICHVFIGTGRGTFTGKNTTECFNYAEWDNDQGKDGSSYRDAVARAEKALETCEAKVDAYNFTLGLLESAREALQDLSYSD